jgi:predicted nucleic acid-binding protein
MEKIYLDVCSLCRPFDDQNFARIRLETDAINLILSKIRQKSYLLMKSPVHIKEIESISDDFERVEIIKLLDIYGEKLKYNSQKIKERTEELFSKNFGIADAAHVVFSEFYESSFISCDDKLLKKCKKYISRIECINPIIFCEKENLR